MANYSGYTQQQYNNQKAYLDGLSKNGTAGQKAWAQNELNSLNSQYGGNKNSGNSGTTQKVTNSGNSGSKNNGNSGGTNYGDYTQDQYHNQNSYLNNMINTGTAGQKEWAKNELDKLNSQYSDGSSGYWFENPDGKTGTHYDRTNVGTWDTSGDKWTNVGGTGVNYAISSDNGTIIVTDDNGVQTRFLPTSADYNSFYQNMMNDIKAAGNNYTPTNSWTTANGTNVTTKDYLEGNSDLKYALEQAMKANGSNTYDVDAYVLSLYNRIGTQRANGSVVTLADVDKELDRLGLSDYNSQNAILTAGQTLLPGNQFTTLKDDNGMTSNSPDSTWISYGGQDYLLGGDSANFVNYVNGKTGNLNNNLSYIFGDMANNPYAQQDPAFMQQYLQGQSQFNSGAYPSAGNGAITGNQNVDNVINYWNSMNNYGNMAGGGSVGTSSLLELLQGYLDSGLEANKGFLEQQKALAQQNAEKAASDAYVNQMLQQDAVRQQMSALGLGTSGALQSAQMGIQGNYGNNLSEINSNLNTMLSSLSEQELQMLTDYYNNMANYAYDVTQYEQQQALQQAQLALQQQQAQYNQQMAERELAMQQAKWDWEMQNYANEQQQYQNETDYTRKQQEAKYYAQLYDAGQISALQYQLKLQELGLISGMTGNTAGSSGNAKSGGTTKKSSGTKTTAQQPANSAVNVEPIYNSLGFRNPLYIAEKYLI